VEIFIRWVETHQASCFFKSVLGIECPGCGTQRAFIYLLKGELIQSFHTYPPLILFLSLIIFLSLHLIFKFQNGGTYLKYLFISTAIIVLINFIYRLINH
jgi:hypothetical protein